MVDGYIALLVTPILKSSEHIMLQIEYRPFKSGISSLFLNQPLWKSKQKRESLPRSEFVALRRTDICNFVSSH